MRENKIERYLRIEVRKAKGQCMKIKALRGWPDRLVLMPGAAMCFVEMKATGKKARATQVRVHAKLFGLGFPVLIIDSKLGVDFFMQRFSKRTK